MKSRLIASAYTGLILAVMLAVVSPVGVHAAPVGPQEAKPKVVGLYTITLTNKGAMEFMVDVPAYDGESTPIQINAFNDASNVQTSDSFVVAIKEVGDHVSIQFKGTHHAGDSMPDMVLGNFDETVSLSASGKGGIRHGDMHLHIQKVASFDDDATSKQSAPRA